MFTALRARILKSAISVTLLHACDCRERCAHIVKIPFYFQLCWWPIEYVKLGWVALSFGAKRKFASLRLHAFI